MSPQRTGEVISDLHGNPLWPSLLAGPDDTPGALTPWWTRSLLHPTSSTNGASRRLAARAKAARCIIVSGRRAERGFAKASIQATIVVIAQFTPCWPIRQHASLRGRGQRAGGDGALFPSKAETLPRAGGLQGQGRLAGKMIAAASDPPSLRTDRLHFEPLSWLDGRVGDCP